jgi:hypothetical protein
MKNHRIKSSEGFHKGRRFTSGWLKKEGTSQGQFVRLCPKKGQVEQSLFGRGFLRPRKWMRGFHDWLRWRSLFMLFGCRSISLASQIIWSMYLDLVERILVSGFGCDGPS